MTPTVTPAQKPPTPPPTRTTPPAPSYSLTDYAFCHPSSCPNPNLYTGYPIGIGFQLSQSTSQPVAAEIWFQGAYQYTSPFSPSSNGSYYDVLPFANSAGSLEVRVFVAGTRVGAFRTTVH